MPTVWDETRLLAGYRGRDFAVARRVGQDWYVAATNGEKEPKTLTLNAPFLAGRTLTLIHDQPSGNAAAVRSLTVADEGSFTVDLAGQGGAVLFP